MASEIDWSSLTAPNLSPTPQKRNLDSVKPPIAAGFKPYIKSDFWSPNRHDQVWWSKSIVGSQQPAMVIYVTVPLASVFRSLYSDPNVLVSLSSIPFI